MMARWLKLLAAATPARHAATLQKTAVLRVLLGELRRLFEESGVVAVAEPTRAAPKHRVVASGDALPPSSITSATAARSAAETTARRHRNGLSGAVGGLFTDAERSLTALEMELDAGQGGQDQARDTTVPYPQQRHGLCGGGGGERDAGGEPAAAHEPPSRQRGAHTRHSSLHEQVKTLRQQVEALVKAREQERQQVASLQKRNTELLDTVNGLRQQLTAVREQRAEELAQTALDVSRVSSASTEWRLTAETTLREADTLRQHNAELSNELSTARNHVAALEARHQQDVAGQQRLEERVQRMQALTEQLSRDLARAVPGQGLAYGDLDAASSHDAVSHDAVSDDALVAAFAGARGRGTNALIASAVSSTSELSQLDRDIKALKQSLHALLV